MDGARTPMAIACLLIGSWASMHTATAHAQVADAGVDTERRAQLVVRGEGVAVTVGELEDAIAAQPVTARARYRDKAELKALAESLARSELLAGEARRRGYESNQQVRHLAKDSAAQALVRSEVDERVSPESIPADDVRTYYETHGPEFHRVAMRRGSQIIVDTDADIARLLPEVEKADARMFAEIAKSNSKDPETKIQGGDLGYIAEAASDDPPRDKSQPQVQPGVRAALFALHAVGDTNHKAVELGPQRAIVRYTAERPERHVTLADAELSIRAKLWRERRQQALDQLYLKLRAQAKPQIFTERIYAISFDDMEKRPSGFTPDPVSNKTTSAAAKAAARGKAPAETRTP